MLLPQLQALLENKREGANPRELTLDKLYAYANGQQINKELTYYRGLKPVEEDKTEFLKVARTGDKIGPALNRYVAGVLGLDPEWSIKRVDSDVTSDLLGTALEDESTSADIALAKELNELEDTLTVWDRGVRLHNKSRELYRTSLWAGKSYSRIYIPDSQRDNPKVQNRSFKDIAEALSVIYYNVLDPRSAGAIVSEHGDTLGYYYRYPSDDGKGDMLELHTPTQIKIVEFKGEKLDDLLKDSEGDNVFANPLWRDNKRPEYLMNELEHPTHGVIDESVIDEQDSLNESKIEMRRNGYMAGYRQYITINANDPVNEKGEPTGYIFGPSAVANVHGVDIWGKDTNGNAVIIGRSDPKVIVVEPVSPETFTKAIQHHTSEILQRFNQSHFESTFLAVSGESKRESKEAWLSTLELDSGPVGEIYATVLRNVLRFAYWLTGKDDNLFDEYEVIPSLNLNVSNSDMSLTMYASDLVTRGHMTLDRLVEINDLVKSKEAEKVALRNQVELSEVSVQTTPEVAE